MSRSLYLIQDNTEEHNMFRSKPTVGSVCGGICGSLPQPYERHHETLSPRLVCMKTRDIFKRMSRSLHLIQDNAEEHDMFRSKPTVGSVCGGICRALPPPHERHHETLSPYILLEKYAIGFHEDIFASAIRSLWLFDN